MAKKPDKVKKRLVDIDAAQVADVCRIFGVVEKTVYNWCEKGCPRKESGYFSIFEVYRWITTSSSKGGLFEEKLKAEIERIKTQTEKMGEKYILRDDHEQLMNSWASSFKKFFMQAVKKNIPHFCNKEIDQLHILFDAFGRQIANAWADAWQQK